MAWTANWGQVTADSTQGVAQVQIQYVNDDGRNVTKTERVSDPSSIPTLARNGAGELQRLDDIAALIANPPTGAILITPELTQDQLDAQTYQQARQQLIQLKQDVDLGLQDQSALDDQIAAVKASTPASILSSNLKPVVGRKLV